MSTLLPNRDPSPEPPSEVSGPALRDSRLAEVRASLVRCELYFYPPARESEVRAWEERHAVRLPADYRAFLTDVASGGEGPPRYGLWYLDDDDPSAEAFRGSFLERELRTPFPFEEAWVWSPEDEEANQRACPEVRGRIRARDVGNIVLGTEGGTVFWHLIVSGASRGQIWRSDALERLEPFAPDFLTWIQGWIKPFE